MWLLQELQELALDENCILVDDTDRALGWSSKRDCHRVGPDGKIKLHRAFSVFLFNSDGHMLLQRRSEHKVIEFRFYSNINQWNHCSNLFAIKIEQITPLS